MKPTGHRSAGCAGACEDGARGETCGGEATLSLAHSTFTIEVLSIDDVGNRDKDQLPARDGFALSHGKRLAVRSTEWTDVCCMAAHAAARFRLIVRDGIAVDVVIAVALRPFTTHE